MSNKEIEAKYKKLPEYIRDILSLKKFTYFLTRNQEDLEYLNDGDDPFEYDSNVFDIINTDIVENEIDSVVIPIIKKLGFNCGWGGELTKCELKVNEKRTYLRFKYCLECYLQNSEEKNKIYNEINAYDDKKIYLHDDEYEWYDCEYDEDDEVYIYLHGFIYFYY